MLTYPDTLPAPNNGGITGEISVGVQRTSLPVALANQQTRHNSPRVDMQLTFSMDNATMVQWMLWINQYGHEWFLMDIVSPHAPVDIFSQHQVRKIGPIDHQKQGDNWNSLSVPIEILPGDKADANVAAPVYDWSIAGTPSSPSTDWSLSGTPASPSMDWSVGHPYYYE